MTTVTQWFSCTTPPVNFGEYEFRCTWRKDAEIFKGVFNESWFSSLPSAGPLNGINRGPANFQWRGLAVKPKSGISSK